MQEQQPEKEKDLIFGQLDEIRQIEIEGYQIGVKRARNALFWVAALVFFGEIIYALIMNQGFNIIGIVIVVVVAALFTGLGFLTKVKPYTALVSGLVAYIVYILLTVALNSWMEGAGGFFKSLFSGIIVKAVIIVILVRAIPDARKLQQIMTER